MSKPVLSPQASSLLPCEVGVTIPVLLGFLEKSGGAES